MNLAASDQGRGWACSLCLHALLFLAAVTAMPKLALVAKTEPFKWDVVLVEPVQNVSTPQAPTPPHAAPSPRPVQAQPARPVEPTTDMVTTPVVPRQSVQMVHPIIEPPRPIEQTVDPLPQKIEPVERKVEPPQPKVEPAVQKVVEVETPKVEPVGRKIETPQPKAEPIEHKVVEVPQPKAEPIERKVETRQPAIEPVVDAVPPAKAPEPVAQAEPVMVQPQTVAAAVPVESSTPRQAHHEPMPHAPAAPASPEAPAMQEAAVHTSRAESGHPSAYVPVDGPPAPVAAPSQSPAANSVATEAPVQVAKAVTPGPEVKADHRWIAETLGRRLAELKRYPSSARLSGQEGKVILKAIIRSDGQLADVSVQKSSGHAVLDAAAMETVRQACPLHMKHDIGRTQIVVNVPIVYSLAN